LQGNFEEYADGVNSSLDNDILLSCFKTLDSFTEEEAPWIVPGWIPAEQITLIAADGGVGKTSIWVDLLSAISSGRPCLLDPPGTTRTPATVAFLTSEDSVTKKLKRKLREAGAKEANIITMDTSADSGSILRELKFGTDLLKAFVRRFRPVLCVFDPVQGFVPPDINMGSRNAMRDCMAPLVALGEEVGTTFVVVCHTNKRKGASGRDRIADSADLWDIARSVLMSGYTEDQGVRYLSQEKNNYDALQTTVLFSIGEDGLVHREGTTWKRDRDFSQEYAANISKRVDCKEWIERLFDESARLRMRDIYDAAADAGYSSATVGRAVKELVDSQRCRRWCEGFGSGKMWWIEKTSSV